MYYPRIYLAGVCISVAAFGQPSTAPPVFEVASIRQSKVDPMGMIMVRSDGGPGSKDPTRFTTLNYTVSSLITRAYGISYWQLVAPEVEASRERFDVAATMAEGTTKEGFELMLQQLLAERFALKVHWDTKEMPSYALVVAKKGPKFKPAEPVQEEPATDKPQPMHKMTLAADGFPELAPRRSGMMIMNGRARWQGMAVSLDSFAKTLSGQVAAPVEDATGLTGKFDLALYWNANDSPRAAPPATSAGTPVVEAAASGPTIFEALKDQLGLALEKRKGPVKILIVDHCEKLPTAN